MIPLILGGVVLAGAVTYFNSSAKSSNKRARREYAEAYNGVISTVKKSYNDASKKDALDKAWKMKRAKKRVADIIYNEVKKAQEGLHEIDFSITQTSKTVDALFCEKRAAKKREDKQIIYRSIEEYLTIRKNLFKQQEKQKIYIKSLKRKLKQANSETKMIQNEITTLSYQNKGYYE